jgi:hypothetical protein
MTMTEKSAVQEKLTAFGAKLDAFAATLDGDEQAWLQAIISTAAAASRDDVQGYDQSGGHVGGGGGAGKVDYQSGSGGHVGGGKLGFQFGNVGTGCLIGLL